jgi:hypothetical protein
VEPRRDRIPDDVGLEVDDILDIPSRFLRREIEIIHLVPMLFEKRPHGGDAERFLPQNDVVENKGNSHEKYSSLWKKQPKSIQSFRVENPVES